jgi:hypothetical protein
MLESVAGPGKDIAMTIAVACCAVLLAAAAPIAQPSSSPATQPARYDASADPAQQLAQAVAQAKAQRKVVLMIVGRDSCRWTRALDALLAQDAAIARLLDARFVLVRVYRSKDHDNAAFLAPFGKIDGVPHLLLFGSDGQLLVSQETGSLEKGDGHDPGKVLEFLRRWAGTAR